MDFNDMKTDPKNIIMVVVCILMIMIAVKGIGSLMSGGVTEISIEERTAYASLNVVMIKAAGVTTDLLQHSKDNDYIFNLDKIVGFFEKQDEFKTFLEDGKFSYNDLTSLFANEIKESESLQIGTTAVGIKFKNIKS